MTTTIAAPGNARYTIETSISARENIASLARQYRITQGEVVECLLIAANGHGATEADKVMNQTRQRKVAERKAKRESDRSLKEALARMPAEQRAALLGEL